MKTLENFIFGNRENMFLAMTRHVINLGRKESYFKKVVR